MNPGTLLLVLGGGWLLYQLYQSGSLAGLLGGGALTPTAAAPATAGAPPAPSPTTNPTVVLANMTNPGSWSAFKVGDKFTIAIKGAPNSPVIANAFFNAAQLPPNPIGSTDGAGNFTYSSQFTSAHVGTWSESFQVGAADTMTLNFTVS